VIKYAYFPGCSASATGIAFTLSADYVAKKIGLEFVEIPDWCCCGTSAALVTDADLGFALPARSLALSERMDPTLDVATPCAGCFASLKAAVHYARQSEENRTHLEELIEMPYAATSDVLSFLEIMASPGVTGRIEWALNASLHGLKVASYYGCALVRPAGVTCFDDVENPQSMDKLMALAGAEPVQWAFKTECCGASHQISEPKGARRLIERIFEDAAENGAEVIVTACPLCMLNLDMREKEINDTRAAAGKSSFNIPVYYFTELLGLAMGGAARELGIDRHFWPAGDVKAFPDALASEDTPKPAPEAAAKPAPKPTAKPTSEPAPKSASEPATAAAPEATPKAASKAAPKVDPREVVTL